MATSNEYSEQTAIEIDSEIRRIVTTQYELAKSLLTTNRDALDRAAKTLLEYETLDGPEVDALLRGETITRAKPEAKRLGSADDMLKKKPGDKPESKGGFLDPTPQTSGG